MSFEIKVIRNDLPSLSAKATTAVRAGWEEAGTQIVADAKVRSPVDTGELRDSVSYAVADDQLVITASAEHATYVHEGTRFMGARPFLREAVEASGGTVESAMSSALGAGLA